MTSLRTDAYRLSAMAAAMAGVLAVGLAPAAAQQQPPKMPQGWFKLCSKQADVDICNVQNLVSTSTGQVVTGISLLELTGKVNKKLLQVTVPTGRLVPPGVGLQIDGGKATKVDYLLCFKDGCIAEAPLTDQLVASFKKGSELQLTSVNTQNQPNPIKVSLAGFTGAFDGPPLKQSDFEDRQKKVQEFVSKNNEDYNLKLKEAQEKAKAAAN
jgi:invasion protein IalB